MNDLLVRLLIILLGQTEFVNCGSYNEDEMISFQLKQKSLQKLETIAQE